jgi:SLT domain-containing protein/phage-related protein
MAEGFKLGSAYVEVSPDTDGFKDKMKAELDADDTEVKVKVVPDVTDFKARLDKALATARNAKVTIGTDADVVPFEARIDEATKKHREATVEVKYNKDQVSALGKDAGNDFSKAFNDGVNGGENGAGGAESGGESGGAEGAMMGLKGGGIAAGITAALSVLPAAVTAIGAVAGVGLGTAYLVETNKTVKAGATKMLSGLESVMNKATEPMVKPLMSAFTSIDSFFKKEEGTFTEFFSVSAKSVAPLTKALEEIIGSVLPALTNLLKGSQPAIDSFFGALGGLGKSLGGFITALGPGVTNSMKVLVALMGDLGNILVFVGKQASIVANTFGGSIIGALGGLTDLIETLLKWIAQLGGVMMPLIDTLGHSLSSIINTAMPLIMPLLTALVGIIDNLIKMLTPFLVQLLNGLKPLMPIITQMVNEFGKFARTVLSDLISALEPLIPILSEILLVLLKPLSELFSDTLNSEGKEFGQIMKAIAPSLVQFAKALLQLLVQLTPLIDQFIKLNAIVLEGEAIFLSKFIPILVDVIKYSVQMTAGIFNVIGAVAKWAAAGKNWQAVWSEVMNWLHKTWSEMVNDIHIYWSDAINYITRTWNQVYTDTRNWWNDTLDWLHSAWSNSVNFLHEIWSEGVNWLRSLWNDVYGFARSLWTDISNWFRSRWDDDINMLKEVWTDGSNWLRSLWNDIYDDTRTVWTDIANWFRERWDDDVNNLKTIWNDARTWLRDLWNGFKNDAVSIWNDLGHWFTSFWNDEINGWKRYINDARSWMKQAWSDIKGDAVSAWDSISSGIAHAFDGVENGIKSPINWMLSAIDKFDSMINKIPGVKLPTNLSFAGGGVLAGYAPGHDTVDAKLSPGESVLTPELTAAIGPAKILAANYAASGRAPTIGGAHYAGGGWNPISAVINAGKTAASDVSKVATSVGSTVSSLWSDTTGLIADPVNWVSEHAKTMLTSGIGTGTLGSDVTSAAASSVVNSIKSILSDSMTVNDVKYKAGAGVEQWKPDVLKALTLNGLSSALANQVLYQMTTESGGNPNAINLWDSNAAAGDPSRGLMQVIATTFSAYHVPGTSENILDPLANIAAAINYAKHVYGPTLERDGMGMGSGHGYASGGSVPAGDTAWVGEQGPELVHFGAAARVTPNTDAMGGIHFHEGSIIINGQMSNQDVQKLKSQFADALSGFNV